MKAVIARISVMLLNEIVIDIKFNPMGVSPRNNPVMPAMPKLKATLKTASSMRSNLFFFLKSMLTKQLPGITNKKIMLTA
jgi:hypothetical protein